MIWSVSSAAQAGVAVLSLFGGFPKKIAPPEVLAKFWTGLASLIATIAFLVVKLLATGNWDYPTFKLFEWIDFVLFALCAILGFLYISALRSKTAEYPSGVKIVGTDLSDAAKAHLQKHPDADRLQLLQAFGGHPEIVWTSDSLTKAKLTLAAEYAVFIALLAFSFNLAIELLAHPVTKPVVDPPHQATLVDESSKLRNVHFDLNKSSLSEDAREKLSENAVILDSIFKKFPSSTLTVEGHCDDQGDDARNLALGYERAEVVRKTLVTLGIQVSKISVASFGKGAPVCTGVDDACRRKNRRVRLRIVQ